MTITASILFVAAATATARRDLPNTLSVQTVRPLQFQSTTSSYLQRGQLLNNIPPIYGLTENGGEVDHVPNTVTFGDNISLGDDYGLNAFHDEAVDGGGNINNAQSPIASTTSSATVNTEGKSSKRETDGVTKQEGFLQTRNAARYSVGNWFGNTWKNILTGRTKLDKVFYNMAFIIIRSVHRCEFYLKYQLSEKVDDYLNRFQDMLRSSGAYKKLNVEERFGENVFYGSKAIACILGCILRLKYYNKSLAKLGTQPAMLKMIQIAFLNRVNLNAQDINVENLGLAERVQRLTTMSNILIAVAVSIASHMGDWSTPKPLKVIRGPNCNYIDAGCVFTPLASTGIHAILGGFVRMCIKQHTLIPMTLGILTYSTRIGLSMMLALEGWEGSESIVNQFGTELTKATVDSVTLIFPVEPISTFEPSALQRAGRVLMLPAKFAWGVGRWAVGKAVRFAKAVGRLWSWRNVDDKVPEYDDLRSQYAIGDVHAFLRYISPRCKGETQLWEGSQIEVEVMFQNAKTFLPDVSRVAVRRASCLFRKFHELKTRDTILQEDIKRYKTLETVRKESYVPYDTAIAALSTNANDNRKKQELLDVALVPIALGMAEAEDLSEKVEVNYGVGDSGQAFVQADFVKTIASHMRKIILPEIVSNHVSTHDTPVVDKQTFEVWLTCVTQCALALALVDKKPFWDGDRDITDTGMWESGKIFALAHEIVLKSWETESE
eukprot:GHVQ01005883.1.p1 GENE.GHVQ01005883.1~~GHVQ01005883.1.p1  ORF type:complete len:737 (+),score=53.70 GHVQ01005883.1:49-2211(+)